MEQKFENLTLTIADEVATIQLNRPRALNALCNALNDDFIVALEVVQQDLSIRALIITGNEKAFAAGADIKEMMSAGIFEAERTSAKAHQINDALTALPIPVIGAVIGPALGGGCELALACDFRIVGESALFGLPEVGLGIIPGAGGSPRLTKLIGAVKAKEVIMLGYMIKGKEAFGVGLASRCVPDDEVMAETMAFVNKLKQRPAGALKYAKEIINFSSDNDLNTSKAYEKKLFSLGFATKDQKEGMAAFNEKRKPQFTHER